MKDTPFNNMLKLLFFAVTTVKYFFKKEFIKENYYKHFFLSIGIVYVINRLIDLTDTNLWFELIVGYGIGYGINFAREWFYAEFKEAKFSCEDVVFGGYGGLIGALILNLTR
jgi:uncharacterized membrane protein